MTIYLPHMKYGLPFVICILLSFRVLSQQIQLLNTGTQASLRGLSVVSDRVIWASGTGGSVGLSTNGGENWKWIQVPGYEKSDFRDIEAFNDREAVVMGITEPAVILTTADGGLTWITRFRDSSKAIFLDAMDFAGENGVVAGDPVNGKIFWLESNDRGRNWKTATIPGTATIESGEAFFAASGSNIILESGDLFFLVSGGIKSSLFTNSGHFPLLINQGTKSAGANSIAINPGFKNRGFVVGGDFVHDTLAYRNSLLVEFNPFKQVEPNVPPRGYRSCVVYIDDHQLIACGTTGVDMSSDGGMHWHGISNGSFHVCRKAPQGKFVFLAGTKGTFARFSMNDALN